MLTMKENFKYDLKASLVVFLIALPLCIGIAVASQTPVISGIVAGIIGGIVTGLLSRSQISVSGPAAGMVVAVIAALNYLGGFPAFLVALFIAGLFQVLFGVLKLGVLGNYIPTSVIKGMLTGIGIIFIFKQIPHLLGHDADFLGDEMFSLGIGDMGSIKVLSLFIGFLSLFILYLSEKGSEKIKRFFEFLPAPIVIVVLGVVINQIFKVYSPELALTGENLVNINYRGGVKQFVGELTFPDWNFLNDPRVYIAAILLALMASIESLLNIEASDRSDLFKRYTSKNRELVAQGIGNMCSGLLGGIAITSVVVRTTTNINSGAQTKLSTILHGVWLLIAAIFLARFIGVIPVASISAILLMMGWKIASPTRFAKLKAKGSNQFIPFIVTVLGIVFLNILYGVLIGLMISFIFIMRSKAVKAMVLVNDGDYYLLRFHKDVSFFNKPILTRLLKSVPEKSKLLIDGGHGTFIDADIIDLLEDFLDTAKLKNIKVEIKKSSLAVNAFFKE